MKQQTIPHYGVRNGLVRKGRVVTNTVPRDERDGTMKHYDERTYLSINAAKRFMRTGSDQ